MVQVWDRNVLPAASGQNPGTGGELTAWQTKPLSHLIGTEETRIPLGIDFGLTSCWFCVYMPVKLLKLKIDQD